jgi:hypothetical protein
MGLRNLAIACCVQPIRTLQVTDGGGYCYVTQKRYSRATPFRKTSGSLAMFAAIRRASGRMYAGRGPNRQNESESC